MKYMYKHKLFQRFTVTNLSDWLKKTGQSEVFQASEWLNIVVC